MKRGRNEFTGERGPDRPDERGVDLETTVDHTRANQSLRD